MIEVELVQKTNLALDAYIELYRGKYHTEPLGLGAIENTILKDMIRKYGLDVCLALISHYFSMSGDREWFTNHAHSLKVFKDNINVINASLNMNKKKSAETLKGQFCEDYLACDSCWKYFCAKYAVGTNWDKTFTRCPTCLKDNKPWKYPTKEEFYTNWNAIGLALEPNRYEMGSFLMKIPYPPHLEDLVYQLKASPLINSKSLVPRKGHQLTNESQVSHGTNSSGLTSPS